MRSTRAARCVVVVGVVVATAAGVPAAAARSSEAAPPAGSWHFGPSGLNGAGFQNVIAASPFRTADGTRPILVGADIAGISSSVDGGATWVPSDRGLSDSHVASFMWSDDVPGRVYAATKSGISVSTDFGASWARRPGQADFDPTGKFPLVPGEEHPRSTGRLLEQSVTGSTRYLWAGTSTQGVKRSADDGKTWQQVQLAGRHVRSMHLDPGNPERLYVAVAFAGLFVSTNARGAMSFSHVAGSPPSPEGLAFVHGVLYVVAGLAGVFRYDGSWHALSAGIPPGAVWESLAGYVTPAGATVLYVGCAYVKGGQAIMRSTNAGRTWTPVTTGPGVRVSPLVFGTTSPWWAGDISYLRFAAPSYVAAQLLIDPDDPDTLLVAGRGGVWRGTRSGGSVTWWPAMNGLMVTVNMAVAADPKVAGRLFIGSMDFISFGSTDRGAHITHTHPVGAPSTGDVVTLDPGTPAGQPSAVYLAASKRGSHTGVGGIWSSPDPFAGGWASEALPVASDVMALGVGHPTSGRVILAGVTGRGLWRKAGRAWTPVTGSAPFQRSSTGSFAWVAGGSTVYALDTVGVWRSDRAGAAGSWVRLMTASATYRTLDALVVDPVRPMTVYVSAKTLHGIWRIQHAGAGSPTVQRILSLANPGPLAVDAGGLLFAHDAGTSRLLRSTDPGAAEPAFTTVSHTFYADNNHMIRSLSIGPDGYIYTASNHAGVSVGVPDP